MAKRVVGWELFALLAARVFNKKRLPIPRKEDMVDILIRECRAKNNYKYVVHTARCCLACGLPLMRHPHNRDMISYTCSKLCRKILRGGRRNLRYLGHSIKTRRNEWSLRQIAAYQEKRSQKLQQITRNSKRIPESLTV